MDDIISRQAAIDAVADGLKGTFVEYRDIAEKMIGKLPSTKPEIILCKDCKYYIPYEWMFDGLSRSSNMDDYSPDEIGCSVNDHNYPPDGFCSCAERRTDEPDR